MNTKIYVCPKCKGKLEEQTDALFCDKCQRNYPIENNIPDFLLVEPKDSDNPFLRDWAVNLGARVARIYETHFYVSTVLKLGAGWRAISAKEILDYVGRKISPIQGKVLDIATGPGSHGRRVASTSRVVYGIDVSLDMMRMGQKHVERESVNGMNFARADARVLPFSDNLFDSCIACGCLHLFPDTLGTLKEISRTLKPGAPLIGLTFVSGETGMLRFERMRNFARRKNIAIVFELPVLQEYLEKAGFENFEPVQRGSALLFTARKEI